MALARGQYPNNGRFGHGRPKPALRFDPLSGISTLADGTPASPLGGRVASSYLWQDTVSVTVQATTNTGSVSSSNASYTTARDAVSSTLSAASYCSVGQTLSAGTYTITQSFIEFDLSTIYGPTGAAGTTTLALTQYDTVTLDFAVPVGGDFSTTDFTVIVYGDTPNGYNWFVPPVDTGDFLGGSNAFPNLSAATAAAPTFSSSSVTAGSTVSVVIPKQYLRTASGASKTRLAIVSANNYSGTTPSGDEYFTFVPTLTFNKFLTNSSTLFATPNLLNTGQVSVTDSFGSYPNILAGSGFKAYSITSTPSIGALASNATGYAAYVEFNTSNFLGTVSSAGLTLSIVSTSVSFDFGIEVYKLDYGTLDVTDWVNPSSLTLVGNINTSELSGQSTITIPLDVSSISFDKQTRLLIYSSLIRTLSGIVVVDAAISVTPVTLAVTIASPIAAGPTVSYLGAATASASGSVTPTATGTGASTLANATASASGAVTVTGTGTSTLADATTSASGAVTVTGTGSSTLANATTSASGSPVVSGTASSTLSDATGAATGSVTATAVGASTLVNTTGSAVGSVTANGTAAPSLANATGSASAVVTAIGTAAPSLANATGAAVGAVTAIGSASPSLGAASASAVGTPTVQASGASTLTNATAAAAGSPTVAGAVTATLGAATSTATGAVTATATGTATLGSALATATGSPIASASGSSTLGNATCIGIQSFPQTITTGIGTIPVTGLAGTSNIGVLTIIGATATYGSRGLITFSGVAGRPQYGAITLTGSHVAPAPGPIDATPSIATFVIEGRSNTPTEGTLAQTASLVMVGAGNPPTITKHLTYWDGTQWRIARFKEWNGSGWAESDRVKSHAGAFTSWEKVY